MAEPSPNPQHPILGITMYPVPGFVRALTALISGAVLLSALAGAGASVGLTDRPAWTLFGFEIVTGVAAALGLVMSVGRFREGPGMALACIAGTIFAAAVMGYISMKPPEIGGVSLRPWLLGRVGCAGLLGLLGAYCVLSRDGRSWPTLAKGLVLALPLLVCGAVFTIPAARGLVTSLIGAGVVSRIVVSVALFFLLGAAACASTHMVIRAFEFGRRDDPAT